MKSTYSLDIITDTLCKDDEQVNIIREILKDTLAIYQWHYQAATDHQEYKNARNGADLAVKKVIALLKAKGQDTLAGEVAEALQNDDTASTLTKSKVLSQAKEHMKQKLFDHGMKQDKYSKKYAKYMEYSFTEWCEKYPLDEAPAHFDDSFEPTLY